MPTGYFNTQFYKDMAKNAGTGVPQTLAGAQPYNYNPSFGGIPSTTSPGYSAGQAIESNIANLGRASDLASQVNAYNRGNFYAGIPNYTGMAAQSSANIGSALRGELPEDVIGAIQQQAAERGISTGAYGSPNANAAYLRALGLTSLDQQRFGEQALTGAVARGTQAPYFAPQLSFVSPQMQIEAQAGADVLNAAPIPSYAANTNRQAALSGLNTGFGMARTPQVAGSAGVLNSILSKYSRGGAGGIPVNQPVNSMAYGVPYGGGNAFADASYYTPEDAALEDLSLMYDFNF